MRHKRRAAGLTTLLAALLVPETSAPGRAVPVPAQTTERAQRNGLLLIDGRLEARSIDRFAVEGDELLVWTRTAGQPGERPTMQLDRLPLQECLAVLRDATGPAATTATAITSDGQRFPGEPKIRNDGTRDVGLGWRHRWLGEMAMEIDSLHGLLLAPDAVLPNAAASDVIVLANGDRLEGVILELGSRLQLDRSGASGADPTSATEVPLGRIAAVGFITPQLPREGHRLWCSDGTVVRGTPRFDSESGLLVIERPGVSATPAPDGGEGDADAGRRRAPLPVVRPDEVLGFTPDASRLVALATIQPAEFSTSGETPRVHVDAPAIASGLWPIDLAPIGLRGPCTVRYPLPIRGCAVIAELRVADADPRWTDFELIVRDGDREILRQRVTATTPPMSLRATLASDSLSFEVTEGEQGPIRDAIEIRRALLVLPEPSARGPG